MDVWHRTLKILTRMFERAPPSLQTLETVATAEPRLQPFQAVPHSTLPDDESLVYGIGDVHGMDDLLASLLVAIESDAASYGLPATVVFLGDLVNRGPQTRQVLDRLVAGPTRSCDRWITLRGNHEQLMLDALMSGDPVTFKRWLKMGGDQTLASYGCSRKQMTPERARDAIDSDHISFLADLPLTHLSGEYLFVHAGVEPGVPLTGQQANRLLTIRGRFLKRHHGLPFTVIHGHTPTDGRPTVGPGRIGVDTGAYFSGILTAVAIRPNQDGWRFISVSKR
jgi:serine/threonine protein phosphatase 1